MKLHVVLGCALMVIVANGHAQTQAGAPIRIAAVNRSAELAAWDQEVAVLEHSGVFERVSADIDPVMPSRTHERLLQQFQGVPVFGGDLTRQVDQFGLAASIFGTIYPDVSVDTTPAITAEDARDRISLAGYGSVPVSMPVTLTILPVNGAYALTWTARVMAPRDGHIRRVFVDAHSGQMVFAYDDTWTQTATTGTGNGVLGDRKKLDTLQSQGTYLTVDTRRPTGSLSGLPSGSNITFDMKANVTRFTSIGFVPNIGDIASDTDNLWTEPSIVDAHANAGYTYDYYFKRHGRHGLNNKDIEIQSFTNIVRAQDWPTLFTQFSVFFTNAAYFGNGRIFYGVGLPSNVTLSGQTWAQTSGALDVAGHELSHGVTDFTSALIYLNESGALNEAFSDIMGTSIENFFQPVGNGFGQADWIIGEDVIRPGGLRSLASPIAHGDPDHYSLRSITTEDNGGVHRNSTIASHAFYLAIVGGTNRVSGFSVAGVGFNNREQIEKVFYRAFTQLMPSNSTYSTARAATIQAARDLYGTGSTVETAVTQAWNAVGVS